MKDNDKYICIGKKVLSSSQLDSLKKELLLSTTGHHNIILDELSTFNCLTIDELNKIFNEACVKFIEAGLALSDFNDKYTNFHILYMLQKPLTDKDGSYEYIDFYRSVSADGKTNLDIIRLLSSDLIGLLSFPTWVHRPILLGDEPVIILVKGEVLNDKLQEVLLSKKDITKVIPVIISTLSETQCKKIMDSTAFKELENEQ